MIKTMLIKTVRRLIVCLCGSHDLQELLERSWCLVINIIERNPCKEPEKYSVQISSSDNASFNDL